MNAVFNNFHLNFLYVEKYKFSDKWVYPPDIIPYEIYRYILSGSAHFILNEKEYHVEKDDVFYIPQGSELSCQALEPLIFISIRFVGSVQAEKNSILDTFWNIPYVQPFGYDIRMREAFECLYAAAISNHDYKILEIRGYLYLITARLIESASGAVDTMPQIQTHDIQTKDLERIRQRSYKSVVGGDPRITIIVDYLLSHPEENLSIEDMCSMIQVSESTLRRLFKERTGKTVCRFVRDNKMLNAARRLIVSDARISSIAYDLGYESPCYFGKCFREVFGVSPQQYRKNSWQV